MAVSVPSKSCVKSMVLALASLSMVLGNVPMTNNNITEQTQTKFSGNNKTDNTVDESQQAINSPKQSAELTSLEEKLATLPALAKYQSKGMQEAIPLLKTVVDKFVLLKDNSPDVCTSEDDLMLNLEQLHKLCDQELRNVGLLPDDYHNTGVSKHPIAVDTKEAAIAASLTILTQALTKAHETGDYRLLHQKDVKELPECLDVLLNSYREEECGLWCQIKKHRVTVAVIVGTTTIVVSGKSMITWRKYRNEHRVNLARKYAEEHSRYIDPKILANIKGQWQLYNGVQQSYKETISAITKNIDDHKKAIASLLELLGSRVSHIVHQTLESAIEVLKLAIEDAQASIKEFYARIDKVKKSRQVLEDAFGKFDPPEDLS